MLQLTGFMNDTLVSDLLWQSDACVAWVIHWKPRIREPRIMQLAVNEDPLTVMRDASDKPTGHQRGKQPEASPLAFSLML